jgi:hypothetical protein
LPTEDFEVRFSEPKIKRSAGTPVGPEAGATTSKLIRAMTKNNQVDQTDETTDIPSDYYDQLRWSTDDLFELGLGVVPSADQIVTRNEYEGYEEFDEWRDSQYDEHTDPDGFGLRGDEICGQWNHEGSVLRGYFPVTLTPNGIRINNWYDQFTQEDVHRQIDLAEEGGILLGISANTYSIQNYLNHDSAKPNAIIKTFYSYLQSLAPMGGIRIDSDGNRCWSYCHLDISSDIRFKEFIKPHEECQFWSSNANGDDGWISLLGKAPCYPSIVDGYQIQLLNSPARRQIIYAAAPSYLKIQFINPQANLVCTSALQSFSLTESFSEYEIEDDGTWNGCLTPDEEEEFFTSFVREQEENRIQIVRKKPVVNSVPEANPRPEPDERVRLDDEITLHDIFPKQIADALVALSEHLPYDPISIAVTFLTALAGMLRLGTFVEGNAATSYKVPINFYTAIVAGSGRKKTPLQNIFAKQPAEDVLLKVAHENDNAYRAWTEKPGKKEEKPPKPIPLDLIISDYTSAALVITLMKSDEMGRSILVSRDEINGLFKSLDQFNKGGKGADEEQLLEIYDGGSFRSLRVGDTTRSFERCAVNILGAVQPEILDGLISGGDASGKWARFIIVPIPNMTMMLPTNISPEMQAEIDCASKLLKDIFSSVYELAANIYKLDAESLGLFVEYEYDRQVAALQAKVSAQASLYGKSAGKLLRFAGILHILWCYQGEGKVATLISSETLHKAMRLVDYTDNGMLALHSKISGKACQKLDKFTRRIHEFCLKSHSRLSWTEIRNQMSSEEKQGKTKPQAEESMRQLVSLHVGEISIGPKGGLCYKALKPLPQEWI